MTNYNNDTLELIPGETPKEKYEWVLLAQSKITNLKTFFDGLKDTPNDATIGNLRSIIDAYESLVLK